MSCVTFNVSEAKFLTMVLSQTNFTVKLGAELETVSALSKTIADKLNQIINTPPCETTNGTGEVAQTV